MDTLAEYHLKKQIAELKEKNAALSKKCEEFRSRVFVTESNVHNLKSKQQKKVKVVVEMLLDKVLTLTDKEIADRLFVDIAYIKNMKSVVRRERK